MLLNRVFGPFIILLIHVLQQDATQATQNLISGVIETTARGGHTQYQFWTGNVIIHVNVMVTTKFNQYWKNNLKSQMSKPCIRQSVKTIEIFCTEKKNMLLCSSSTFYINNRIWKYNARSYINVILSCLRNFCHILINFRNHKIIRS